MSNRIHKAIFERRIPPLDNFSGEPEAWEEVCREWVRLEPLTGRELFQAQQVQSQASAKACAFHSVTLSAITTEHRLKIERPTAVDNEEPNADANYRIFHIESIVNVREQNRELEFMVIEKV